MSFTIQLKRGNEVSKPSILPNGEAFLALDTGTMWVGQGNGQPLKKFISTDIQTKTFAFINPADNSQSAAYIVDSAKTLTKIRVFATSAPTANTTVNIMRGASNGSGSFTQIATVSFTTATPSPITLGYPVSLATDDVLYAVISGSINGLTNLSVQIILN